MRREYREYRERERKSSETVKFLFDRNTNFRMLSDTYNRCIAVYYCIMKSRKYNCTAFLLGQKGFTRETVIVWCCVHKVYITPYREILFCVVYVYVLLCVCIVQQLFTKIPPKD